MNIYDIKEVDYRYSAGSREVLKKVSFTVKEGGILSILGPNGAGKSTLLDIMAGLRSPVGGTAELKGERISEMKPAEIARIVGYVPQVHTPAFSYTVIDFVTMGRAPAIGILSRPGQADKEIAYAALEEVGVSHLADKPYTEISGGERQQVTIARAVCQNPEVILFDEPTAHLDYGNQHRILRLIKKLTGGKRSAVITTHNPDHALLLGGRAAIISSDGILIEGESDEIITEARLIDIYKSDMRLLYSNEMKRKVCLTPAL
jgi:iron complex transport system ATP-binding protein